MTPPEENPEGSAEFIRLWPTLFMAVTLPGSDAANSILSSLVMQSNAEQEQMTTNYLEQNLFQSDHPAIGWLTQCCTHAVMEYARELGMGDMPEFSLQGWPNVNFRGDYHNLHNHPHSWLSGTYYLNVPDQDHAETFRSDLNPGAISFFDPRGATNMTAMMGDGQHDPEYRRVPKAGQLFLWPAFLYHLVHPNLVETPRLSISFNVVVSSRNRQPG